MNLTTLLVDPRLAERNRSDKTPVEPSAEETREAYEEALRRAGYDPITMVDCAR
jgi:hypothetical protein